MSKKLLKNTKFKRTIEEFYKINKDKILDIILFGSYLKGKEKPKDIDLMVLFKDKKNLEISYNLNKKLKTCGFEIEIIDKSYKELFEESFKAKEFILSEGHSLIYKKSLSEGLGYMSFILFKYELKGFSKSDRMRFYYSLYGRSNNQKGILKEYDLIKFSRTILFCPVKNSEKVKEYLKNWKIKYIEFPINIPERIKFIF